MDILNLVFKLIEVAPRLSPPPKPPMIDYTSLIPHLPDASKLMSFGGSGSLGSAPIVSRSASVRLTEDAPPAVATEVKVTPRGEKQMREVATACLSCTRSHLATIAGLMGEALRFARAEGILHPEVQERLNMAEQEVNVMERIDLSPQKIQDLPPVEAEMAREYLPKIRVLRQDMGNIESVEALEAATAEASVLGQEFRLRHLQTKGVDLNPVVDLARRVKAGELTIEEAKAKLKTMLPDEED
jgi:hypothetical protein